MPQKIMFGYEVAGVKRLKNKTFNITLNTQELNPQEGAALLGLADYGFCMLKDANFDDLDMQTMDDANAPAFGKTPSEKLRSALFVKFKHQSDGYDNFNDYYRRYMENLRQEILADLPEQED